MNFQNRIAAARYGAAYDSLSTTTQEAEQNARQLRSAAQILEGVSVQLQSPRFCAAQKKLILGEALKEFPRAAQLINVLIDAKRLSLLNEICAQVEMLLDDRKGISRAVVTSARELDAAQQKAAQKALSARYGKTVEAVFKTQPDLLGGLTLECNGELLDGSLKTRLEKLRQELTK